MSHMIELHKVSKYYTNKDTVSTGLSRIDLTLDMGEFVAITGESGSGKSTLLNVISGLDTYEEGEMFVGGQDTSAFKTEDYERYRKTFIGNIFQDFNLVNSYSVYQNIELSMLMCGMKHSECKDRVNELIELVDLGEYRRTNASRLSGGQKQRVAIARALAKDSPIIVADEPTGNLDTASAAKVIETLHRISKEKLVVIVTHNYEQVEKFVTRKITVHDGKIIEDKEVRERHVIEYHSESEEYLGNEQITKEEQGLDANRSSETNQDVGQEHNAFEAELIIPGVEEGEFETTDSIDFNVLEDSRYSDVANRIRQEELEGEEVEPAPMRRSRAARNAEREAEEAAMLKKHVKTESNKVSESKKVEVRAENTKRNKSTVTRHDEMGVTNELRLGLRNTFNLPTKFVLLFIIYLFVATSVLGQYATTKDALHRQEINSLANQYFNNTSAERIIVKKADNSSFTDEDYTKLKKLKHVKTIIKEDPVVDTRISINSNVFVTGLLYPGQKLKAKDLTYGTLPEQDNDIVLVTDKMSASYDDIKANKDELLGNEFDFMDDSDGETIPVGKARVTGIIIYESMAESGIKPNDGTVKYYCSDALARKVVTNTLSQKSKAVVDFNGQKVKKSNARMFIEANSNVPKGEAYIYEDQNKNYKDEKWQNKPLNISISNIYYSADISLKTTKSVTKKNVQKLIGFSKDEYDIKSARIYINPEDAAALYDKGTYQISVFVDNDLNVNALTSSIEKLGDYKVFAMKKMISKEPTPMLFLTKTIQIVFTAVGFVVLFFISYMIIRLIMRSRNSYYATLRILGGTRKNTSTILRVELLVMMAIALVVDFVGIYLMSKGVVSLKPLKAALMYLDMKDYVILTLTLMLMSLLIANRYSRKIFKKSAMNIYREED
mgnify:FL=1